MQATKPNIRTAIRYTWLDLLDWFEHQNANLIGLLITALLSIGLITTIVQLRSVAPAAPVDPIIIIAPPPLPAMAVPTAQVQQVVYVPAPAAPVRWVTAFASPENNIVLGPIPEPAVSAITGRWGDSWVS